jgi:hypothetical protein
MGETSSLILTCMNSIILHVYNYVDIIYMDRKHIHIYSAYQNLLQKILFIYDSLVEYSAFQNTL